MVLEQLLNLRQRSLHVFLLGLIYAFIGMLCGRLIFPGGLGLMSVAFIAVMFIPSLTLLLQLEERREIREKKFSIPLLVRDHRDVIRLYLLLFLAVFCAYGCVALLWPGEAIRDAFSSQLATAGFGGLATLPTEFGQLLTNNLVVLAVCFLLSLVYGAGAVLFLTWNASVWGIVIGVVARDALLAQHAGLAWFVTSLLPLLPHLIGEAVAYISAAVVGGVVSKAVLQEKLYSQRFHHVVTDALILLAVAVCLVVVSAVLESALV